jgi:peptidoglycan/xylan/chitin deacetylase (PgdA/CDA1 family)
MSSAPISLREKYPSYHVAMRLMEMSISILYYGLCFCFRRPSRVLKSGQKNKLVVLTYHNISSVQTGSFARQMDQLLKAGSAVFADSSRMSDTAGLCIAVTFDDGYGAIVNNALPVLYERKIPATIFVATKYIGSNPGWISDGSNPNIHATLISQEQLKSLPEGLIRIGSHTHTHAPLGHVRGETLEEELTASKRTLESLLNREISMLSLPYGSLNRETLEYSSKAGYRLLFLNVPCPQRNHEKVNVIGRIHVSPDDWNLEYLLKLQGAYHWISCLYRAKRVIKNGLCMQ